MGHENNGMTVPILQALHDEAESTKREINGLEGVLKTGFDKLAAHMQANTNETKLMRESLVSGLLGVIKVLCYLLAAVVMWVTSIKGLTTALEKLI